ncbi:MAG: DUF1573 domain-containing protein [Syntrophobacteraceae bacterium]|nr:DUF1573 domain-containing protein [Syntrophobacteraceae bacterium]
MAYADKAIPPGGEGKITLKLNPRSCSGETKKSAVVTSNDPMKPYFILVVQGTFSS